MVSLYQDLDLVLKFFVSLLSIINPLGVIPVFISLTDHLSDEMLKRVAFSCSLAVLTTIALSLLVGELILSFFGISISSFTIGGGILVFSMAFNMVQAKSSDVKLNKKEQEESTDTREIGIVPLAIPLLSGPGAISTSIIQARNIQGPFQWGGIFIATLIIATLIYFIFSNSRKIRNRLGKIGLNIMTRVMGIILLAIAIEMFAAGLVELIPALKGTVNLGP